MKPLLHKASNGFLMLEFGEYDSPLAVSIAQFLESDWGFGRSGPSIFGIDEGIFPNFVRGSTVLAAGWDHWSGQYFLSDSEEGDKVLGQIFNAISFDSESNKPLLTKTNYPTEISKT